MKVIVGLGNPGLKYENTRHNMGFKALDRISEKTGIPIDREKFSARYGKGRYKGEDVILLRPETYMNLSGIAVRQCLDFYKLGPEDIIVLYDDVDTPVGKIRLRPKGSAGGHNGMKSIIEAVFTSDFDRIRMGIDRNPQYKMADWVLGRFSADEMEGVNASVEEAADAALEAVEKGFSSAMNHHNKK